MPAMAMWGRGDLSAALDWCDTVMEKRIGSVPAVGADQLLTFRSRLLADLGDIEAAGHDQRRAIDLFSGSTSWADYHRLELAMLEGIGPDEPGWASLVELANTSSSLLATQAHGWLGIEAARVGDADTANRHRRAFASLEYDAGWEWGYPTRPGFDRAQGAFALLIGGYSAIARGDFETADRQLSRALRAAPQRWQVVPVVSLDGRAHLAAREGIAAAARALGDQRRAANVDRWVLDHPLETVMLTQAGSGYRRRAAARLG
jgi:tetratricopeptide (TPR) repeat protein